MNENDDVTDILSKPLPIELQQDKLDSPQQNPLVPMQESSGDDIQDDYELARKTLRELVTTSQEALAGILNLAKTSEHPRAYEVLGQLIKTTQDAAKDLLEVQKQRQAVTGETPDGPTNETHIGNAIFVGSTNDLQALIKQKREQPKVID